MSIKQSFKQAFFISTLSVSLLLSSTVMVSAQDSKESLNSTFLPVVVNSQVGLTTASDERIEQEAEQFITKPEDLVKFQEVALNRLAERLGVPVETLLVVNAGVVTFSFQNTSAFTFKIDDSKGESHSVGLSENGEEVDLQAMMEKELSLYDATYGRLDPALHETLQTAPSDQPIEVILHLHENEYTGPQRPETNEELPPEKLEAFLQEVAQRRVEAVAALTKPVLEKLGQIAPRIQSEQTTVAQEFVPMISTTLLPDQIQEVATWAEISRIYPTVQLEASIDVARLTTGADVVQSYGINGNGQKVAVVEVGGGINTSNPYLAGVFQDTIGSCLHPHATAVVGIIRSTHALHRGIAPASNVWVGGDCGGSFTGITSATNRAKTWGARAVNLSLGANAAGFTVLDPFYDDLVRNSYITIVPAAGNNGGVDNQVRSPGLAHNVITVGSQNDGNTVGWGNDVMASYSSWLEFSQHGDRELPNVVAPGSNINSTINSSPWIGAVGSGTSYAAPVVTGEVALLMQRHNSLTIWPESVKAIVMTSAIHNIEGSTRLSEFDGAGSVAINKASEIAPFRNASSAVNGSWGGIYYSCNAPYLQNLTTMFLTSGTRTRTSIVWDNNHTYAAAYQNGVARPSADIDMRIISPSGTYVTGSASWDNTSEIVDFTAPTTGTYTVQVVKYRCDSSPDWLGWAWQHLP